MESTEPPRQAPPEPRPTFGRLVYTYVKHGSREYLARLLQIRNLVMDEDDACSMGSALHHAIVIGDEIAVRMMLDAGVSPTVRDCQGYTPLATAAEAGQRGIARLLWQLVGPDGRCPVPHAPSCLSMAAEKGHADLVADFLEIWDGWSTVEKRSALSAAAAEWHDGVVGLLLAKVSYDADAIQRALELGVIHEPMLPVDRVASRVLIATAEQNLRQQRVVRQLVDAGASPHMLVYRGRIPCLHAAAAMSHRLGALRELLEKGADANIRDQPGKTALHSLFKKSSPSSIHGARALLQHGASPELADEAGQTGLHAAAYGGTLEMFQLCLTSCRNPDAALRLVTSHGETLLHYATAGGREDIVSFLLSRGLDANATNANGWTPLICALMPTSVKPCYPQCSLARLLLLEHGASAQAITHEGWTVLHGLGSYPSGNRGLPHEMWDGVAPLVRELIARGAPLDAVVGSLKHRFVGYNRFVFPNPDPWGIRMRSFARYWGGAESRSGGEDLTPLVWARRSGAKEVVEAIREHGGEAAGEAES